MYSEQLLNLGRIHLYLLHASNLIDEKRVIPVPPGVIHRPTLTDFGKEVENDEINWWVFKREANILELKEKTIIALQSAEILKKSSEKLFRPFHTSEEFTLAYERFAKERNLEIKAVLDYVKWLFQKDELAPAILYNYRTWGSTRMSDRTMVVQIKDIDDTECLKNLTDIVLGKLKRGGSVIDKVRSEMEYELFENMVS
ncbi:MAG: hypothetical protein MUO64_02435 [Anaerolineales bacterium]|nr:hypothetical protein [Anaerolineales bacterium]